MGIGVQASVWRGRHYLAAGFQDATGNQETPDLDSLGDGRFFYFAEAGWEPRRGEEPLGSYRATFVHSDRVDDGDEGGPGNSIVLTANHSVGRQWWAFGRFAHSWGRVPPRYETALVCGVELDGVGCFAGDAIGLGAFWVHPSAQRSDNDDAGLEAFWRLQLTQRVSVTPSAQFYASRSDAEGPAATFGVRLRLDF